MAIGSAPRRWTYEEFAKLPGDDGNRYEVIAGELYVTPSQGTLHQELVGAVVTLVHRFATVEHRLGITLIGPIDVLLAEGDFMVPDLVFVRRDRREVVTERAVEGVPDLIVEVVSELTEARDRGLKQERYVHYGVPEYWIVDAGRRAVHVYRFREGTDGPELVVTDSFTWQPVPDGPVLTVRIPELLEGYDELSRIIEASEAEDVSPEAENRR